MRRLHTKLVAQRSSSGGSLRERAREVVEIAALEIGAEVGDAVEDLDRLEIVRARTRRG